MIHAAYEKCYPLVVFHNLVSGFSGRALKVGGIRFPHEQFPGGTTSRRTDEGARARHGEVKRAILSSLRARFIEFPNRNEPGSCKGPHRDEVSAERVRSAMRWFGGSFT